MKEELIYDNEAPAKATYRKNLLQSMFALARAEQQVKHDERGTPTLQFTPKKLLTIDRFD